MLETDDEKLMTEESGNTRPDGVVILRHNTEPTEEQTDTEQPNTLVLLDSCRSGGNTTNRMRASHEERRCTYKDRKTSHSTTKI